MGELAWEYPHSAGVAEGWGKIGEEAEKEKSHCWLRVGQHGLHWDLGLRPFRPWKSVFD